MTMEGYVGEIRLFAGNFAPRYWAFCDGSVLAIADYQCLFEMIGAAYGGDGRNTFALPDLRARAVVGAGQGPGLTAYAISQATGTEQVPTQAVKVVTGNDGGDLASVNLVSDNNLQPLLGLNFIICFDGIVPQQ